MELMGLADDFVEVEGPICFLKYISNYIYIRLGLGWALWAASRSAAGQAQGAELGLSS